MVRQRIANPSSSGSNPLAASSPGASIRTGIVLCIVCILLAAAGYAFGDPSVILRKAASVCLECIGVG